MKKVVSIFLIGLILTSCGEVKNELYDTHLHNLVDGNYEVSTDLPLDVVGRYSVFSNENSTYYLMELIFENAITNLPEITILVVDGRQDGYKDSPLNLGYFNETKLNLVTSDIEKSSKNQHAIRFTWRSDTYQIELRIAISHLNNKIRETIYTNYSNFALN